MMTPLLLSYTQMPEALLQFPFSANLPTTHAFSRGGRLFQMSPPRTCDLTGKRMGGREKDNHAIC